MSEVRRADVGLRSDRGPVLLGVMLATALVALDSTIIATASTSVTRDLGQFQQLPWLFSIYVLAQAVTVPVWGRLGDVLGRKRLLLTGLGLFLLGSVLAGAAWSMPTLIIARAVQGIGAGAVPTLSMTIMSDIYSLAERAKAQGYVASVWGVASVIGPTIGGVFSEWLSWRWIFWINVPIAVAAGWMLISRYHEHRGGVAREPIDYLGAALMTPGTALLVLALLEGGQSWAWDSPLSIGLFAASAVLLAAFVWWQLRVRHPLFSLAILRRRVVSASTLISLIVGVIVLGLTAYVPVYAQDVLGVGPLVAGLAVAALTLGWPLTAAQAGRVYLTRGFRFSCIAGSAIVALGAGLMMLLGDGTPVWVVAVFCFITGCGMGLTVAPSLIAAQTAAAYRERGFVTGTNMFARSIGSAVGVAAFGAIINALATVGADGVPEGAGLMTAMRWVFGAIFALGLVLIALSVLMPVHVRDEAAQPSAEGALGVEP